MRKSHLIRPKGLTARESQLADMLEGMFQAGEQQQQAQEPKDTDAIPVTVNRTDTK